MEIRPRELLQCTWHEGMDTGDMILKGRSQKLAMNETTGELWSQTGRM